MELQKSEQSPLKWLREMSRNRMQVDSKGGLIEAIKEERECDLNYFFMVNGHCFTFESG